MVVTQSAARLIPGWRRGGWPPSKPAAMTVTLTSSSASSMTVPKMMFASSCAAPWIRLAAAETSNRPRSEPPAMERRTPWAPSMLASSKGDDTAISAAAGRGPHRADPMPISAEPAFDMIDFTSAKSRLIRPGGDQIGDAGDALHQHLVGLLERVQDRDLVINHLEQLVVGDHDQGVDLFAEVDDSLLGLRRDAFPRRRTVG